jgi:hypothetical protein
MTTGPGATSPDSAGKPIAPRAMEPSIQKLLLEAEREAQRLSSYARMAMALALAIGFVVLIEQSASPLMVVSALGAMACYFVIGFISLLLSWSRVFRPWLAGSLTALDMSVYAFVLLGVLRAVDLPPSQFEAVPPFLLVFVLITLSGLRYTPVGVAIVLSVGTLVGLSVLLAGMGRMACRMVGRARPARIAHSLCERRQSNAASARRDNSPVDGGDCSAITQAADSGDRDDPTHVESLPLPPSPHCRYARGAGTGGPEPRSYTAGSNPLCRCPRLHCTL